MLRRLLKAVVLMAVAVLVLVAWGYRNAGADPVVRRVTIALPHWPAGARPLTVVLLADIHFGNAAMDEARLQRIVAQVDALRPDLILIAGDFVYGYDPAIGAKEAARLATPLGQLRARRGVFAVLGNHDQWTDPGAVQTMLRRAGITVLDNRAIGVGPLALGGVGDSFSGHDAAAPVLADLARRSGAPVLLTHSPDLAAKLPVGTAPLVLAGHTHCGQVVLPWFGSLAVRSPKQGGRLYDPHYQCGLIRDPHRLVVVTAGLGASVVPLRFGAPPDLWLLTLGP